MKKLALALIFTLAFQPLGFSASEWVKTVPGSTNRSDLDTLLTTQNEAVDRLVSNYRRGMSLSYSSGSQLTAGIGEVTCSNSAGTLRKFRANTSATTVTWTNIDTGAEANSTTYYVYAVADADATTATFKISVNSTTPTGATYYKRLGSFYNNSSGDMESVTNDDQTSVINTFVDATESSTTSSSFQDKISQSVTIIPGKTVVVLATYDFFTPGGQRGDLPWGESSLNVNGVAVQTNYSQGVYDTSTYPRHGYEMAESHCVVSGLSGAITFKLQYRCGNATPIQIKNARLTVIQL